MQRESLQKKESRRRGGGGGGWRDGSLFASQREQFSLNSSRLQRPRGRQAKPAWLGTQPQQPRPTLCSLKEKEMANYVEGSMQYSRSPSQQAQRKAKPATNPDVHQTRQDCNCVLAIRMQRYTMYYYVVVMLLCCKWPLLAILQRLRVHWEKKKKCSRQITSDNILPFFFMTKSIFGGDQRFFFLPSFPFLESTSTVHFMAHSRPRSRFQVSFFLPLRFCTYITCMGLYGPSAILVSRNGIFKKPKYIS